MGAARNAECGDLNEAFFEILLARRAVRSSPRLKRALCVTIAGGGRVAVRGLDLGRNRHVGGDASENTTVRAARTRYELRCEERSPLRGSGDKMYRSGTSGLRETGFMGPRPLRWNHRWRAPCSLRLGGKGGRIGTLGGRHFLLSEFAKFLVARAF